MNGALLAFTLAFGALLAALLVRSMRLNHALIGLAAIAGAVLGLRWYGLIGVLPPLLVLLVAAVQVATRFTADRRARFSPEEEAMLAGPLAGLSRARARHFLDHGLWLTGRAGDVLTREGESVGHLYYLAAGEARVDSGGRTVGSCGPGQLIGEGTILSPDAATATVTLTRPARFWCAPASDLIAYLKANDEVRHALEHGFTVSLRAKLDMMNRATAGIG